jgi:hypothetical protein
MGANTFQKIFNGLLTSPLFTKANSAPDQWAGLTTINSGSATQVVSTALVNSDSIIMLGCKAETNVSSGIGKVIEVKSLSSGGYFVLGTSDGQAMARNTVVMWQLVKTS